MAQRRASGGTLQGTDDYVSDNLGSPTSLPDLRLGRPLLGRRPGRHTDILRLRRVDRHPLRRRPDALQRPQPLRCPQRRTGCLRRRRCPGLGWQFGGRHAFRRGGRDRRCPLWCAARSHAASLTHRAPQWQPGSAKPVGPRRQREESSSTGIHAMTRPEARTAIGVGGQGEAAATAIKKTIAPMTTYIAMVAHRSQPLSGTAPSPWKPKRPMVASRMMRVQFRSTATVYFRRLVRPDGCPASCSHVELLYAGCVPDAPFVCADTQIDR